MTLDGLEKLLWKTFSHNTKRGGKYYNTQVNFIRYADDFILTGRSKELLEDEVKPLVEQCMRERGLQLSPEKTVITHIEEGFDFLGQNVRKYKAGKRYKLLIKPSKKNVHAFLEKIRDIVKANDEWIAKKYFATIAGNNWVFYGTTEEKTQYLTDAVHVPIKRHTKIRGEANPYEPEWESYYEKRLDVKMVDTFKGKQWLVHLWKEQGGLCPVCHQKITKITGWHSQHILWRSKGGPDTKENRVLLHPTCHQQVHSQGLPVTKPPPLTKRGVRKA